MDTSATPNTTRQVMGNAQALLDHIVQQIPVAGAHDFACVGGTVSLDHFDSLNGDDIETLSSVRVYHPRYTALESQRSFRSEATALWLQSVSDLHTIKTAVVRGYRDFVMLPMQHMVARWREAAIQLEEPERRTQAVKFSVVREAFSVPITAYRSSVRVAIHYTPRPVGAVSHAEEAPYIFVEDTVAADTIGAPRASGFVVYVHAVGLILRRLTGSASPANSQLTPPEYTAIIATDAHSNGAQSYQG